MTIPHSELIDINVWDEIAPKMRRAFEEFYKTHTLKDRSIRELFYHGFYAAWIMLSEDKK